MNRDTEGNYIQLLVGCGSFKINLINLYAPNTDSPKFFQEIDKLIANEKADHVVVCGDFNLVLDHCKASQGYININNPKARSKLLNIIVEREFVDIFRVQYHPDSLRYTWRKKNPVKQSRLDFFLISSTMADIINSSSIRSSYRSDHSIIEVDINLSDFKHGKGYWKCNNSLLKNPEYLKYATKIIEEEKVKYALPVYNMAHITANKSNIDLTISYDLFFEK